MIKLNKLIDLKESDDPGARDFADEMAYYLSAGEAEARAVENRLRMPARLRNSADGHPYGTWCWGVTCCPRIGAARPCSR